MECKDKTLRYSSPRIRQACKVLCKLREKAMNNVIPLNRSEQKIKQVKILW